MSTNISKIAQDLQKILSDKDRRKTTPYDTSAEVVRVDDNTLWVHIPGGVDETPVKKTVDAHVGDSIQVHIENGGAWAVGNSTRPPTDDATANYAVSMAAEATDTIINVQTYVTEELVAQKATIGNLEADTAKIHNLTADELTATVGYISDLTSDNITAANISADHATIGNLSSTYATIDELHSDYAEIDLANVNNAWIQNGVVKDAAISDAQIIGVSANKLTAGTIDASNITVTNLNASNITTGSLTVDGITIDITNNEASIDGSYIEDGTITLNGLAQEVTDKIDGAIETFTGTVVPTLNNYPASSWTTSAIKDTHIGDVYYVINAGNQADGYCYRFAKSGNTYQWVLIKDSDVTAALGRLTTAEGKITGLESFESTTSSWITETDEELSSLKTNVTSLTTRVGEAEDEIETKVNTSTFNTLSQTVGENSASITTLTNTVATKADSSTVTTLSNTVNNVSQTATTNSSKLSQLTTTLGTNSDGTTKAGDIVHKVSDIDQDLDSITTRVGKTEAKLIGTYATSSTAANNQVKVATITPSLPSGSTWELTTGTTITVKFVNRNTYLPTAANPLKLNVNSTGAKIIKTYNGNDLSEAEYKWPAGATMAFVYDGTNWRVQDSTELTRLKTAESSITQTADSIVSLVANNDTYTKPDGTTATNTIKSAIKQNADNIELRVEKSGVIASINASTETSGGSAVRISADKVNIEGAAIFTGSGRLSTTSLNNTYDPKNTATNTVNALKTDLASSSGTTVIDGDHITSGSILIGQVNGLQSALNNAAETATGYITYIDSDNGIRVYDGQSDNENVNFTQINSNGMQIYHGGDTRSDVCAEFVSDKAQIGKDDEMRFIITPDKMTGLTGEGGKYLNLQSSVGSATTRSYIYYGQSIRHLETFVTGIDMPDSSVVYNVEIGGWRGSFDVLPQLRVSHIGGANWTESRQDVENDCVYTITYNNTDKTLYLSCDSDDTSIIGMMFGGIFVEKNIKGSVFSVGSTGDYGETYPFVSTFGQGLIPASNMGSVVIGNFNEGNEDALFVVGGGEDDEHRETVFKIDQTGAIYPKNKRMFDWVTAYDGSGRWMYRKWSSGRIEAWYNGPVTTSATTATGNIYRASYTLSIPSVIGFSSAPRLLVSLNHAPQYVFSVNAAATSATSITGYVFRANASTTTYESTISIYAWTD